VGKLVAQAGLAHPGFADDRHHLAMAGGRVSQRLAQGFDLLLPPHKAGEPAGGKRLEGGTGRSSSRQFEHLHRGRQALDRDGAEWFHLDVPLGALQGLRRQQHRARLRHLLHAGRQMGRLAHRRVVHMQAAVNAPHHPSPRMESDTDLHRHPVRALHLVAIPRHGLLHVQRRITRPHRMIFMGDGRAKQRHNAIAHDLIARPLIAVHGLQHQRQDRVEELTGFLGVAVGQ
jgi:hypothetical protein